MFRYEKEMIPVLIYNLSKVYKTEYLATEFNTGNGVADIVLTTSLSKEHLMLNEYSMMAIFNELFLNRVKINLCEIFEVAINRKRVEKLIKILTNLDYISIEKDEVVFLKKYQPHTKNLISIEAKLKDWKSGYFQARRYQFFSNKTFLAYPQSLIHRVDIDLLKSNNIGLISVSSDSIEFIYNPKSTKPEDTTSHLFLSELFAKPFKFDDCN